MFKVDFLVLLLANVANVTIGLFSYLKSHRNLTNKLFTVLTSSLVVWTTANYLSIVLKNPDHIFAAVQAILVGVVIQNTFFFLFVLSFPGNVFKIQKGLLKAYMLLSVITLICGIYPGFFSSYAETTGSITPNPSPFISLFMLHTAISIVVGIAILSRKLRSSHGILKKQYKFLLFASSVLLLIAPFTNFLLPVISDVTFFVPFGPLYTFSFASLIAYAMVKHRLLDFKLLLARALGYVLTISFLALTYTAAVFGVSTLIFSLDETADVQARLIYTALALVLAYTFNPIKKFFDRLSNKFFFQDAYEPQVFLDELNRSLVANIELNTLLLNSAQVIQSNLKAEYCAFSIAKSGDVEARMIGTNPIKLTDEEIKIINEAVPSLNTVIFAEDITHDSGFSDLQQVFQRHNIAVVVRLIAKYRNKNVDIGFVGLGPKLSGNSYNDQDLRLLGIISNELVIAIENALRFEEIEAFNITLQEKVNDATRQLRRTNEKLKALDETKDEFISMASHQLRTPLTSVKGYMSMVLEGDAGKVSAAQRKLLEQAFTSSQRMVYLIADLLNVSRLHTGKFVIESQPTNLADVVEGEIGQLTETAKGRGLELVYEKPADFPTLMLDETKIRQVIMNFIDNAIYYTPSGGHIKVELRDTDSSVEFTVTDDGIGIPRADQHHLFAKFYRAGNARKARPDGTGLGLFMAKKVVVAQGGSIIFKSAEGKGSTFGFSFAKGKLKAPGGSGHKEGSPPSTEPKS